MATCVPAPEEASSRSSAELALLRALDAQLGPEFTVLHSVAWIGRPQTGGEVRDGEADIVVAHPSLGLLVVEVKGGRILLDYRTRHWTSTDRAGVTREINNPFEQAKRSKFSILEKLKATPAWRRLPIRRVNLGHAAFFPDVGEGDRLGGPDAPRAIIGDRSDMTRLAEWVKEAFAYWSEGQAGFDPLGRGGVDVLVSTFARTRTARPLLSARIQDEEGRRLELTERQATVLNFLQRQRRVMVVGGAGTGKTLIAREKAVRTAREGFRTLLVCYNRGLADYLREQSANVSNLDVATFHQVCHRWLTRAKAELGRDLLAEVRSQYPGADEFGQLMPIALALAVDAFGPLYEAIVVDEGQDFGDEFWMPIEMLLTDLERGLLYVFFDENQDIYRRSASVPIRSEPIVLDRNCRNTASIHKAAYRHYRGAPVECSEIEGVAVELMQAPSLERQASAIGSLLSRLISVEKVRPHQIAVLLCNPAMKHASERALATIPLPKPARYGRLEDYGLSRVTVDTVARFKGLEREVIILWAFDDCNVERDRETLYVGTSRAKSALYLCGSRSACERLFATDPVGVDGG